jgi:hypothetical protein
MGRKIHAMHGRDHLPSGSDPIPGLTIGGGGGSFDNEVWTAAKSAMRIYDPSGTDIPDAAFYYPSYNIFPRYLLSGTNQFVSGTWSGLIVDYTDISGFTKMAFYGYQPIEQWIGTGGYVSSDILGFPYQDCGHGTIAKDNVDGNPYQAKCHFLLIPNYDASGYGEMFAVNPTTGTLLTESNLNSDFGVTMDDSGVWLVTINWAFAI